MTGRSRVVGPDGGLPSSEAPLGWREVDRHLQELLELPEEAWPKAIDELRESSPELADRIACALNPRSGKDSGELLQARFDGLLADALEEVLTGDDAQSSDEPAAVPEAQHSPGEVVGPYRVVELLGSGGMGEVYRAVRVDGQFDEEVALKIVRHGVGRRSEQRFLQERQVLAQLQHAHIAAMRGGGLTVDGAPYLAMELVDGEPITAYCDRHELDVQQRLRLFDQVLDALSYAHRNMVVHRDLKPSNVLVSGEGAVKLLDFGIAKLLDDGEDGGLTRTQERLMTPEYASPEQIRGEPVSVASDVYSLGVLLFELLTGTRPFLRGDMSAVEFQLAVLETEAPRLTGMLTGQNSPPNDAGGFSGRVTPELCRQLRGDLEAIVAKCLRKEPEQRYLSVSELAADLRNHREGLPVAALRGSRLYATRKFAKRHWLPLAAASVVFVSLLAGLGVALLQVRAARVAERKAAAINRFLTEELLAAARPDVALGRDVTVREIVATAEESIRALGDQPELVVSVRRTLASVARSLGDLERAETNLREAEKLADRVSELERARLEIERAETQVPSAAVETMTEAIGALERELGRRDREVLRSRIRLGEILLEADRPVESEALMTDVLALVEEVAPRSRELASVLRVLGAGAADQSRREENVELSQQALALQEELLGRDHPDVASTLTELAHTLSDLKRFPDAEAAAGRALVTRERLYGESHPLTLEVLRTIVDIQGSQDDERVLDSARELYRRAQSLPPGHRIRLSAMNDLWRALELVGLSDEAVELGEELLVLRDEHLGRLHGSTLVHLRNQSRLLDRMGRAEEALELAREVRMRSEEALLSDSQDAMFFANQAQFFSRLAPESERDLELALRLALRSEEMAAGALYFPPTVLADVLFELGRLAEATDAQERGMRMADALHAEGEHHYLIQMMLELGDVERASDYALSYAERLSLDRTADDPLHLYARYLQALVAIHGGAPETAETQLVELVDEMSLQLGPDHLWMAQARVARGLALYAQGRDLEAVAEIEDALRLRGARLKPRRFNLARAVLADLAVRAGELDEAKRWRQEILGGAPIVMPSRRPDVSRERDRDDQPETSPPR